MAASTVHHNFRDGTITFSDGTGTPITGSVIFDEGDFSVTGLLPEQTEYTSYLSRGQPGGAYSHRKTNWVAPKFSFSCKMTDLTDATEKLILDACRKTGAFAAGKSTLADDADVWTLEIVWTIESSNFGDAADHVVTIPYARITEFSVAEGDPNMFSISGDCLAKSAATDCITFAST